MCIFFLRLDGLERKLPIDVPVRIPLPYMYCGDTVIDIRWAMIKPHKIH